MAQINVNVGDTGATARDSINSNFTELYAKFAALIASEVGNDSNVSGANVQEAIDNLLATLQGDYIPNSEKGIANGVAPLNGSAKIDSIYLPGYVDDVEEHADLASFPATGESGKIYVAIDTGKTYRWGGSAYVEISPSDVISVFGRPGAVTAQAGDYTTDLVTEGTKKYSQWGNVTGGINYADGNVGIGVATPGSIFEVQSDEPGFFVNFKNSLGSDFIRFFESSANSADLLLYDATSATVRIRTVGNTYFNAGNVGIGTTLPSAKLEVNGDLKVEDLKTTASDPASFGTVYADRATGKVYTRKVRKSVSIPIFASDTNVAVGDGKLAFTIPSELSGFNLVEVIATVSTLGVTGTTNIQVRRKRGASSADMLSTLVTIGNEYFAADGVINTANDDIATGDAIYIDIDAVHSGTAPEGLSVVLTFEKP